MRYVLIVILITSKLFGQNSEFKDLSGDYGGLVSDNITLTLLENNQFFFKQLISSSFHETTYYSIGTYKVTQDSILMTDKQQLDNEFIQQFCTRKADRTLRKRVKIRVVDFDDNKIGYPCIHVMTSDNKVLSKTQANKNGKCILDISSIGQYRILITKEGFKPLRLKFDSTDLNNFKLVLLPEKLKRFDYFDDKAYHIETRISVSDIIFQSKEITFLKK